MAEVALGPLAAQCPHVEGSRHRHPRGMTVVGQAEMAAGARRAPPVAVVAVVASGDVCYCRVPFAVRVWRRPYCCFGLLFLRCAHAAGCRCRGRTTSVSRARSWMRRPTRRTLSISPPTRTGQWTGHLPPGKHLSTRYPANDTSRPSSTASSLADKWSRSRCGGTGGGDQTHTPLQLLELCPS